MSSPRAPSEPCGSDRRRTPCPAAPLTRSIKWTPDWLAWTVDEIVFRNLTNDHSALNRIPWRPMSFRIILHTQNGSLVPAPDGHVFLRRIAFTPFNGTNLIGLDHKKCGISRGNTRHALALRRLPVR